MDYIIDYELCTLFFIIPFGILEFTKKRISNLQNISYMHLIVFIIFSNLLDICCVLILKNPQIFSVWSIFIANSLFYTCQGFVLVIFLIYVLSLTGALKNLRKFILFFILLPYIIYFSLICTTQITHLIFYIDESKHLIYGKGHFILYFNALIYLSCILYSVIKRRRTIEKKLIFTVFGFVSLLIFSMIFQFFHKNYLLDNAAAGYGIVLAYIILQSSVHNTDKNTGLFNHNTIAPIVNSLFEKKKTFYFIIFSIDDFKNINKLFGIKSGNNLLKKISEYLCRTYGGKYVILISNDQFGVVYNNPLEGESGLTTLHNFFPNIWSVNDIEMKISISTICLYSRDYIYADNFINNIDYSMSLSRQLSNNSIKYLDKKTNEEIIYQFKVETILQKAIDNNTLEVYFQPIYNLKKQKFTNLEALARLYDDELGYIPPSVFIKIAEQNGLISKLGEIVIEKVCMLLKMNDLKYYGCEIIEVNLSVAQCMQNNLSEHLFSIIDKYQIPYNMLCFEVTETAASTSFQTLKHNMNVISKRGIKFALDDYGMGYSNMDYLMNLPFTFLKTDKQLLWSAMDSERNKISFECILYMAEKLELVVISEGVENKKQLDFLSEKNVELIQGFYYSKPLKPEALLEFYKEQKNTNDLL